MTLTKWVAASAAGVGWVGGGGGECLDIYVFAHGPKKKGPSKIVAIEKRANTNALKEDVQAHTRGLNNKRSRALLNKKESLPQRGGKQKGSLLSARVMKETSSTTKRD